MQQARVQSQPVTWIVIANGSHARIFEQGGRGKWQLVEEMRSPSARLQSKEIGTDKPGRQKRRMTAARPAMEPKTDPQSYEKLRFSQDLATFLNAECDAYDRLILIAAPKTLGELRVLLHAGARSRVVGENDRDLTHIAANDLPQHLQGVVV